jgi:hypothetical protein
MALALSLSAPLVIKHPPQRHFLGRQSPLREQIGAHFEQEATPKVA